MCANVKNATDSEFFRWVKSNQDSVNKNFSKFEVISELLRQERRDNKKKKQKESES